MHELQLDCSEVIESGFQDGDIVPEWATAAALLNKEGKRGPNEHENPDSAWKKVIVMDPPTLKVVEAPVAVQDQDDTEVEMSPGGE